MYSFQASERAGMCVVNDCVPLLLSGIYAITVYQVFYNEGD